MMGRLHLHSNRPRYQGGKDPRGKSVPFRHCVRHQKSSVPECGWKGLEGRIRREPKSFPLQFPFCLSLGVTRGAKSAHNQHFLKIWKNLWRWKKKIDFKKMVTCLMICCWPTFLGKMQFDQDQLQLTFLRVKSQTCPLCIFSSNISPILFF